MTAIQNEYQKELASIETIRNIQIDSIDESTLPCIVETVNTVYFNNSRYDDLLGDIAVACARYDLYTSALANSRGNGRIENEVITPIYENKWLCGQETKRVPAASTVTQNYQLTFSLSAGQTIKGWPLSVSLTLNSSVLMSGPPQDMILTTEDGTQVYATHNVALSMLKGTLIRMEYDYVDNVTGDRYHFVSILVEESTAYIQNVTTPASFGSSLICIRHGTAPGVVRSFSYESDYHSKLKDDPTYFF